MYKNIIFDVGEVLFSYRWKEALEDAGETHESAQVLQPLLFDDPLWKELDLGVRPHFDVVEDMCHKYMGHEENIRRYLTDVSLLPIDRPRVWAEVKRLKDKGYKLYLLSNYSEYMFKIHTAGKPFMDYIDGAMVSYMINVNKPDRRIYEALLRKYDLNASECIYFDDRKENTDGAVKCGIDAITVLDEEFLIDALKKL